MDSNLVLIIVFAVTFTSFTVFMWLKLRARTLLSFVISVLAALIITEIVYVFESMFSYSPPT